MHEPYKPGPAPAKGGVPACSQKYSPSSGGYNADALESGGAPGDKGEGGFSAPSGSENGDFNHDKVAAHGNYPHSPADPEVGGPPIGTTVGPNGDTNQ